MMGKKSQESATVKMTTKNQITIPKMIREALQLKQQDHLKFKICESGEVTVERVEIDDFWTVVTRQEKDYGNLSTPELNWHTDVGTENFD
ncbi:MULTISPECIES: type II toxin-antitoxin system PrlF family antitoxin [Levilactobacillus]|uniref:type II toxin-antitoxin system PrlF family antitoxin n=2 Tax=Lactobacillaceae TaxID=33958 RepID=UPI001EF1B55D|nr:type II toxin-antitoxin system PrlF family antitoxin [Levilactobacillus sp. 244-2]